MKKIVITSIVALAVGTTLMAGVNAAACKGCHGQNFEKHALGQSKIVKNMTHKEISTALKGFKAGTYKGSKPKMKGVMQFQVKKYSNEDLEKFSKTIGM